MGLRAEGPEAHLRPGNPLRPPRKTVGFAREARDHTVGAITGTPSAEIAMAAQDKTVESPARRMVERLATWVASPIGRTDLGDAQQLLGAAERLGFDRLLAEHRESWAQCWSDAEVTIEGDPESELAARFAVFHLLSAAGDGDETAVGARGLTGDGYAGHVFWDADVFVLPALAAIRPAAARAMLEYRIRRLPAAQALARARGFDGARFPCESAGDGSDVTPRFVRGMDDELVPIATGSHEEHIVADVAWSAMHYAAWTGDSAFLAGGGGDLVVETARYWASRIQTSADGRAHLYGMMGPDEYHDIVDDNAYTNVMARWNIRRGAEMLVRAGDSDTATTWTALADRLVDGWDPQRQLYEQFIGYFDLEPLLMSEVAPPPVAVDRLLGAERVAGSQLIKQADVLMLHHLVPEEVMAGSLEPCVAYYEPRTAHGSSLSPAIHASLLARAGEPERALELFRLAARLDLDDLTGTTADGVHLATMGGVWQALAFGFLGVSAAGGALAVRPCLPEAWRALVLRFRFVGRRVGIRAEHDRVTISSDPPLLVRVGDGRRHGATPRESLFPSRHFHSRHFRRRLAETTDCGSYASSGTITSGTTVCSASSWLVLPRRCPACDPWPREPTTIRSAATGPSVARSSTEHGSPSELCQRARLGSSPTSLMSPRTVASNSAVISRWAACSRSPTACTTTTSAPTFWARAKAQRAAASASGDPSKPTAIVRSGVMGSPRSRQYSGIG
jgi:hypothetical protein